MKTLFRSSMLMASIALSCSSCELIPDEVIDIFEPDPRPEASCRLSQINHPSAIPDEAFITTIDTTGGWDATITTTSTSHGEVVTTTSNISKAPEDPNVTLMLNTTPNGLNHKEITVDELKRLKRVAQYFSGASDNLTAIITTYDYDGSGTVKATTLEIRYDPELGEQTDSSTTLFEYKLGNLTKITYGAEDDWSVVTYKYGSTENKLYGTELAYIGLDLFSPMNYNAVEVEVPMPSRKLPTKQTIESNQGTTLHYTWTINRKGYPTKVDIFDENMETRSFEYGYESCTERGQN